MTTDRRHSVLAYEMLLCDMALFRVMSDILEIAPLHFVMTVRTLAAVTRHAMMV
jgi:hypothetical protein